MVSQSELKPTNTLVWIDGDWIEIFFHWVPLSTIRG